jgi:hypothetical protein
MVLDKKKNITFNLEGGNIQELKVPVVGQFEIQMPPYFATKTKKGWKLLNPITTIRNLAKRNGELAVGLKRDPGAKEPQIAEEDGVDMPSLKDFSAADQKKLIQWDKNKNHEGVYPTTDKPVKARGRPAFLPKNAVKQGLTYKAGTKTFGDNKKQPKAAKPPKPPKPPKAAKPPKEPKKRGRPAKAPKEYVLEGENTPFFEMLRKNFREADEKEQEAAKKKPTRRPPEPPAEEDLFKTLLKANADREESEKIERDKKAAAAKQITIGQPGAGKFKERVETLLREAKKGKKAKEETFLETMLREANEGIARKERDAKGIEIKKYTKKYTPPPEGKGLFDKIKALVVNPAKKALAIGDKLIHGRNDYPPSAQKIIDKYGDKKVVGIALHRKVLKTVFTKILSVWTKGETEKRLAEEPKDKLFHISMWVTLEGGTTILCEKNEVITFTVSPKKADQEEVQAAKTPANTTFKELLDKGQAEMGDRYFPYSAKDNNCGNWIEGVLKGNKINDGATKAFIGQDTKKIMSGFPKLRKALNTLTDIAGRANVVMEGGDLEGEIKSNDNSIMRASTFSNSRFKLHPAIISPMPLYSHHPNAMNNIYYSSHQMAMAIPTAGSGLLTITHGGGQDDASSSGDEQEAKEIIASGVESEGNGFNTIRGLKIPSSKNKEVHGSGMKKKRFVKGSQEAKDFMASIRRKKGSGLYGGAIPAPHSRDY